MVNRNMKKKSVGKATAGLVLGILSIPSAFIPIFGIPIGILGIVFSVQGMKQSQGIAVGGLVCSIIGLIFAIINAVWGAYLGVTGQHELVNKLL